LIDYISPSCIDSSVFIQTSTGAHDASGNHVFRLARPKTYATGPELSVVYGHRQDPPWTEFFTKYSIGCLPVFDSGKLTSCSMRIVKSELATATSKATLGSKYCIPSKAAAIFGLWTMLSVRVGGPKTADTVRPLLASTMQRQI